MTFLQLYLRDQAAGQIASLEDYQRRFPGHEAAIAEAFEGVASGPSEPETAGSSGGGGAPASDPAGASQEKGELDSGSDLDAAEALAARAYAESGTAPRFADLDSLGPYRIVRELGSGGQGEVFLAEDTRLGRSVALKVLAHRLARSSDALQRFRREASIASRLDHPNLCTVFEADAADGIAFVAMQFIEGRTLAEQIAEERQSGSIPAQDREVLWSRVQLIEEAARAIHAAHCKGVVHRDLKPSNLMCSEEGRVVVLDFGLARSLEGDEISLTGTGDVFGTPAYMAPEQVQGSSGTLGPEADVYSLGVTLFEFLTLERPFGGPTREALYQAILNRPAPDVRQFLPDAPRALSVVLRTAMAKEPRRRYASALDLAEDLKAVRERRPIAAKPPSTITRVVSWARRDPVRAALVCGLSLALLAAAGLSGYLSAKSGVLEEGEKALEQQQIDRLLVSAFGLSQRSSYVVGELENALRDNPELDLARAVLGLSCLELNRPGDALRAIQEAPAASRGDPAFGRLRKEAQRRLGLEVEADSSDGETSALLEFVEGSLLYQRHKTGVAVDLHQALQHLDRAILLFPRAEAVVHMARMDLLVAVGDRSLAEGAHALLEHWPDLSATWHWVGLARRSQGDLNGAADAFREAIRRDSEATLALLSLSILELELGNVEESELMFQRGLEQVGKIPGVDLALQHSIRGQSLLGAGYPEPALESLDRALRMQKVDDVNTRVLRAKCLAALELPEDAAEELAEILDDHPGNAEASRALCDVLRSLDDSLSLEEELRRRVEVEPRDGIAWYQLAGLLEQEGDPEDAERAALRALRMRAALEAERPGLGAEVDALCQRLGLLEEDG